MQRINWIDWAKFLAVALTVPCHVPQELGAQPVTYFEVFLLQVLFFNSGYLKKPADNWKQSLQKYWHRLIIPYLVYNALFYPYWIAKFYMTQHYMPTLAEALRPITGMLFLQMQTGISCWLNPVTYFLAALLVMHLTLDICHRLRHELLLMSIVCLSGIVLYTLSRHNNFTHDLVTVGFFKSIPFYYMGYLTRKYGVFEKTDLKQDFAKFIITFVISIILFNYHANETDFARHMISYWPTVLSGLLTFTYFCRLLDGIHSQIIVNYSNGTMAFIGLHWMLVGTIRYGVLAPVFHVPSDYVYTPLEAYALALAVTLLIYPIILLLQKEAPWMLGKQKKIE